MQLLSKSRFAKGQIALDAPPAEILADLMEGYDAPGGDPVVVVGGGPSGLRAAQELLRHGLPAVLLNAERWRPYNRIKLTPFLAGEVQIGAVYQSNVFPENAPITQYNGHRVVSIDRAAKTVENQFGRRWHYSYLVLCLGSRAHIPPIPGRELPGVFSFRNFDDVEQLIARSIRSRCTVVIGGGLLGLEAARGMALRNIKTIVVEHENRLMARQIDSGAGELLAEKIRTMGLEVRTGCSVKTITGAGRVESIVLSTGETIACDTAIICTGIRSNIELARDAGIAVGHGITVNDAMQTSDPSIYAVGECAEHNGHVYGLVSPGLDQAAVAAARIGGIAADYRGSVPTTKLKVVGTDVFSMGDIEQLDQRTDVRTVVCKDSAAGTYRRLVLRRGRLVGAFGVGGWPEVSRIQQAVRDRSVIWPWQMWRFARTGLLFGEAQPGSVASWPAAATVCNCTGVTRGRLGEAVQGGAVTLELLTRETSACTVCGTCRPLLLELLGGTPTHEPVFGARMIATASLVAACIALAALLLPAWPYSSSVVRGIGIDALWIDGTWKQVTGFTLVGLSAIVAFLSIRKRLSWRWLGSYRGWRIIHAAVGAAVLGVLFLHTGFHLGQNLNRWLMMTFIAVVAAGCVTGIATAREHRLLAKGAKSWRNAFTWTHILAFWPLPLLLFVHIVTVYAY
jgi:NADPH-dependent 2,4-dienoyl-CoA reductase/sulfur reductase-like enzyme/bacterioferritin-associated ferredoxin